MQTTIYFIRHGKVHNPDNILYGRLPNFGLSEKGKLQIEKTAEFLQDKHIDKLYASPLHRTRQTAEIIKTTLALPTIQFSDQILEVKTSYQGIKFSDLDDLQSEIYLKPLDATDETIEQIAQRMKNFLDHVIKIHTGKQIAAVSHGDPIMILQALLQHKSLKFPIFKEVPYIKNGQVMQITSDEQNNLSITSVFKPFIET